MRSRSSVGCWNTTPSGSSALLPHSAAERPTISIRPVGASNSRVISENSVVLPRAVRAEQGRDPAGEYLEAHIVERLLRPIVIGDVLDGRGPASDADPFLEASFCIVGLSLSARGPWQPCARLPASQIAPGLAFHKPPPAR